MTTITFDTHAAVKRLLQVGYSEAQAEAVTSLVQDARDVDLAQLATKADLQRETSAIRAEIEIAKRDIVIKIGGMLVVITTLLLAAIRYLPPHF